MQTKDQPTLVSGKRVYLSGPMTGHDGLNVRSFDHASSICRSLGATRVYNPCHAGIDKGVSHEDAMLFSIRTLVRPGVEDVACTRPGGVPASGIDMVVTLDGWQKSEGARLEVIVARACGIPVVRLDELETDTSSDAA